MFTRYAARTSFCLVFLTSLLHTWNTDTVYIVVIMMGGFESLHLNERRGREAFRLRDTDVIYKVMGINRSLDMH